MQIKTHKIPRWLRDLTAFIFVGVVASAVLLFWQPSYLSSVVGAEAPSTERIWHGISCRIGLFLQKAKGDIPDLSWSELWVLLRPALGYRCMDGISLEAGFQFSSVASEEDRKEGARIFGERCGACHGHDGSGGPHAPSLTRSAYNHGDSDLAIYKLLRDGNPGTSMPSAELPLRQLLQVTAHVKTLQGNWQNARRVETPRLTIQVSIERLNAA